MASSSTAINIVQASTSIWRAMAGSKIEIPQPNTFAYYFPEGHCEQNQINPHDLGMVTKPLVLCKVIDVKLSYHEITHQPRARFTLQPVDKWWKIPAIDREDVPLKTCSKILTAEDVSGRKFDIPDPSIFPHLPVNQADNLLWMKGVEGREWFFEQTWGSGKKQVLYRGWETFVRNNTLVAGDTVTFLKKLGSEEVFVAIKKTSNARAGEGAGEVISALQEVQKGSPFEVTYYPYEDWPEFVVSAHKVYKASKIRWFQGMWVQMSLKSEEGGIAQISGSISIVRMPEIGLLKKSPWKMLQVIWEGNAAVRDTVNPWEVQLVHIGKQFGPLPASKSGLPPSDNMQGQ